MLVDPRLGDAADDASSTMQRSWLDMIGSLLVELSPLRFFFALIASIAIPGLIIGFVPLAGTYIVTFSEGNLGLNGCYALAIAVMAAIVAFVWQPLRRTVEANFWTLNATVIQPVYVFCRELSIYAADRWFVRDASPERRVRQRSRVQMGAGAVLCLLAAAVAFCFWPGSKWYGDAPDLAAPWRFLGPAWHNAMVLVFAYAAIAFAFWGVDDALMAQAEDLRLHDNASGNGSAGERQWRVAHFSDTHVVGEHYGFRLETGRNGPRGNDRLRQALARLADCDRERKLDLVLISGDLTDSGRSAEWVEFIDIVSGYPELIDRMLVVPGNHDVNVIDRANPARLEFPFSRGRGLRQVRAMSAIDFLQGDRVHVVKRGTGQFEQTLSEALEPHRGDIAAFAGTGTVLAGFRLRHLWHELFPMILPPDREDGLGVVLLNSNATTSFSFTNALGMVSSRQRWRLARARRQYPGARWIILLHHHLMEYPTPGLALSERIGTALINGTWLARRLRRCADSIVVMHGHRHFDWAGRCGGIAVVSAPSTVMTRDGEPGHFWIHTFAAAAGGRLLVLTPEKVDVAAVDARPVRGDRRQARSAGSACTADTTGCPSPPSA